MTDRAQPKYVWTIVESPAPGVGELPDPSRYLAGTVLECPVEHVRIRRMSTPSGTPIWGLVETPDLTKEQA